jgi:hypothetical protein
LTVYELIATWPHKIVCIRQHLGLFAVQERAILENESFHTVFATDAWVLRFDFLK